MRPCRRAASGVETLGRRENVTAAMYAPRHGAVFVGRERELAELVDDLDAAAGGRGSLILLVGEPGIGKSRLADELASVAHERDFVVLWGRCWEAGGAPTYWPWVQAIRTYLREVDAATVREQMGAGAAEIAQMIPDVRDLFPDLLAPAATDPEGARFRLFDRVATFLRDAADRRPILLVLDDLESADTPSLLFLRFVATVLHSARMLVLGAYRDPGMAPDSPLAATLVDLRREPTARSLMLRGLEEPDVTRFIDRTTGMSPPASLVAAVYTETEGNPLFVGEVVRLLAEEGRLTGPDPGARLAIPQSVLEVIGQRLEHLSAACKEALTLASLIGQEFEVEVLARLVAKPARELVDVIDEATRARAVTAIPGVAGRLRFAHALIRDSLYDAIPASARLTLHRRAGEVLEALYGIDREAHLAELVHHFFLAIPEADPERAVEYARRAGHVAVARLAFEEAARLFGIALEALKLTRQPDDDLRCELLLGKGDAHARAGDTLAAKDSFFAAADLARRLDNPEQLSRAAIGYGGRIVWLRAGRDRRFIPLLEDALRATAERSSPERVRLMARLACALRGSPDRERSANLGRHALEMARELGDPRTLAYALNGRLGSTYWPENPTERLELAEEMVGLADAAGDLEDSFEGHHWRAISLVELGQIGRAASELDVMRALAEELRQPTQGIFVTILTSSLELMRGRFRQAEEFLERVPWASTPSLPLVDAGEAVVPCQRWRLLREAGRLEEAVDVIRPAAESFMWYPFLRCAHADVLLELGDGIGARAIYEELAADRFSAIPRDSQWMLAMSLISPVCAALDDVARAEVLYAFQHPYAARHAFVHEGSAGSVSRALGLLATVLGRLEDAERHFEYALEMNRRMGARPWVAHTQHDLAKMLVGRDAAGDREAAVELLRDAESTCAALQMVALGGKVEDLVRVLGATEVPERGPVEAVEPRAAAALRREGEYWSIEFEGDAFRLRDSKGLRYLSHLLMAPGREIHALELVAAVEGHTPGRATQRKEGAIDVGDAGELLDERAKAEYRTRLIDLEAELSEAEEWNDPERAARLREERDFLARELAGAIGLGGRDRVAGSNSERARVNVTRAIRSALDRIQEHSPPLGRHLAATVRTGSFCSYQPDTRSAISWSR
jgi:tetratricopeptide (TPR) repeat protein